MIFLQNFSVYQLAVGLCILGQCNSMTRTIQAFGRALTTEGSALWWWMDGVAQMRKWGVAGVTLSLPHHFLPQHIYTLCHIY